VRSTDERFHEAELYRLQGELLLAANRDGAEVVFRQSLAAARRQSARSLELRAAMSLSRLLRQQGNSQEAHALLVNAYGWFSEGLETSDLKEARMILEGIS